MQTELPDAVGPYNIVYYIGSGTLGEMYQGYNPKTGERVTLKFYDQDFLKNNQALTMINREITICKDLSHENILKLLHVYKCEDLIVIVTEAFGNGTIESMKENSIVDISQSKYLKWTKEILEGMNYLHKHNIVHHDIRPSTIGLDEYMNAKIIDFDLCEKSKENSFDKNSSLFFSSPEVLLDEKYNGTKADIWSFGVTLHYLVTGVLPFKDINAFKHIKCKEDIISNISNKCPAPLNVIVDMALCSDPNQRPTAQDLLNLDIFNRLNKNKSSFRKNNSLINSPMKKNCLRIVSTIVGRNMSNVNRLRH